MLIYNNLQPHIATLDYEDIDISSKKSPHRLFIE